MYLFVYGQLIALSTDASPLQNAVSSNQWCRGVFFFQQSASTQPLHQLLETVLSFHARLSGVDKTEHSNGNCGQTKLLQRYQNHHNQFTTTTPLFNLVHNF